MAPAPLLPDDVEMDIASHARPEICGRKGLSVGRTQPFIGPYGTVRSAMTTRGMTTEKQQFRTPFPDARPRNNSFHLLWSAQRVLIKPLLVALTVFVVFSICHGIYCPSYASPPKHYQDLEESVRSSAKSGRGNPNNEKIFIAANIVEERLIRGSWGNDLLSLVDLLGEQNVFVSIYENDSGPGTVEALRQLQQRLPCNSSVVTGDHVPLEDFPTVLLPDGTRRVQRITYLAEIRNRLLRPLDPFYTGPPPPGFQSADHIKFDRILFLNDVYYSPLEAVQLLFSTNVISGLAQYRAACAIDFVQFFKLYDTFVVRDTDGYGVQLQFFPWFTRRGSGTSRKDVLSLTDAVQVRSCWGGMAAFDASMFQSSQPPERLNNSSQIMPRAIKFRSQNEPFWESAECCLVFADMEMRYGHPSTGAQQGVFLNPYIRTAYSSVTWRWLPFFKRLERMLEPFQYLADIIKPPETNPRRTHEAGQMVEEDVWTDTFQRPSSQQSMFTNSHRSHSKDYLATRSYGHLEKQIRRAPAGGFCGMRRMFVMKRDVETANRSRNGRNWESIHIPWNLDWKGS